MACARGGAKTVYGEHVLAEARAAYEAGAPRREICERTGMTLSALNGRAWREGWLTNKQRADAEPPVPIDWRPESEPDGAASEPASEIEPEAGARRLAGLAVAAAAAGRAQEALALARAAEALKRAAPEPVDLGPVERWTEATFERVDRFVGHFVTSIVRGPLSALPEAQRSSAARWRACNLHPAIVARDSRWARSVGQWRTIYGHDAEEIGLAALIEAAETWGHAPPPEPRSQTELTVCRP